MTIARRNGKKDYEEPVFDEEYIIMVENQDDVIDRINPSGPVSPVGSEDDDATERVGTRLFQNLPNADRLTRAAGADR